ncbi:hypothetical protein FA10DRAFT_300947 [Acaromyces ingoldii]|uniref:WD40 repeat-like protein n=1 Tax=Acaromyces ingoldii TaxID=215250 RepID=A0A316YXE4_9BASI|nr:hypothetical protein FA10DRAFT_300947 [Acaromyces ingoldii]PWN92465.1 hypothetical protein FA10DRAFT_300947 [Acaromyces ingoldii]
MRAGDIDDEHEEDEEESIHDEAKNESEAGAGDAAGAEPEPVRHHHASTPLCPEPRRDTFWRRVVWSCDGTHLLCQSEDHHIDLFCVSLPSEQPSSDDGGATSASQAPSWSHTLTVRAPSPILAVEWYPLSTHAEPWTWCFAMSCRDVPVKLVDATTGQTRATYGIIDHVERFLSPLSLAFDLTGTLLYCGLKDAVAVFALAQPGNEPLEMLHLGPTGGWGASRAGQRGLVSCLAVLAEGGDYQQQQQRYDDNGEGANGTGTGELLAVGTLSGTVALYRLDARGCDSLHEGLVCAWKDDDSRGLSQLAFHPSAPHVLFTASRRSDAVRAFDLRYVGTNSLSEGPPPACRLGEFPLEGNEREGGDNEKTQQRLFFDVDGHSRTLVAGGRQGQVSVWDVTVPEHGLRSAEESDASSSFGQSARSECAALLKHKPIKQWRASEDVVACTGSSSA